MDQSILSITDRKFKKLVLAALAGSQLRGGSGISSKNSQQHITHEMAIPNDIIGCIIGKGGTKIAEIR